MDLTKFFKRSTQALIFVALVINGAYAQDITVVGTLKQTLKQAPANLSRKSLVNDEKSIQLLQVHLSDEARNLLTKAGMEVMRVM